MRLELMILSAAFLALAGCGVKSDLPTEAQTRTGVTDSDGEEPNDPSMGERVPPCKAQVEAVCGTGRDVRACLGDGDNLAQLSSACQEQFQLLEQARALIEGSCREAVRKYCSSVPGPEVIHCLMQAEKAKQSLSTGCHGALARIRALLPPPTRQP